MLALEPGCEAALQFVAKAQRAEARRGGGAAAHGGGDGGADGPPLEEEEEDDDIDPYAVLGVAPDANAASIKSAFRRLALQSHPDKQSADASDDERRLAEERFQTLNLAHALLNDPVKRRQYDVGGRVKDIMK